MTCEQALPLLGAYVDQELNAIDDVAVRSHIATCESCRAEVQALTAIRAVTQNQPRFVATPSLMSRIEKSLPPEKERRFHPAWLGSFALGALCGALFLFVLGPSRRTNSALEGELVASHVRSLMPKHLLDVVSSDRHTVKPWFAGKVSVAPSPWDLSAKGFKLVGGRLDLVSNTPTAVLVYKHKEHLINLFVLSGDQAGSLKNSDFDGFHVEAWTSKDLTYAAISDMDLPELKRFASEYRSQFGVGATEH